MAGALALTGAGHNLDETAVRPHLPFAVAAAEGGGGDAGE